MASKLLPVKVEAHHAKHNHYIKTMFQALRQQIRLSLLTSWIHIKNSMILEVVPLQHQVILLFLLVRRRKLGTHVYPSAQQPNMICLPRALPFPHDPRLPAISRWHPESRSQATDQRNWGMPFQPEYNYGCHRSKLRRKHHTSSYECVLPIASQTDSWG